MTLAGDSSLRESSNTSLVLHVEISPAKVVSSVASFGMGR